MPKPNSKSLAKLPKAPVADSKVAAGSSAALPYKPTPAEMVAKDRYRERRARRPPARVKVSQKDGVIQTGTDHSDLHTGTINLMNACGTASTPFLEGLLNRSPMSRVRAGNRTRLISTSS